MQELPEQRELKGLVDTLQVLKLLVYAALRGPEATNVWGLKRSLDY